jgi:hypothetical protein
LGANKVVGLLLVIERSAVLLSLCLSLLWLIAGKASLRLGHLIVASLYAKT